MKRKRQSWATRPLPPITAERIEQYLDFLAGVMAKAGKNAELFLPIWKRLELELEKRREVEAMLSAARKRVENSRAPRAPATGS